MYMPRTLKSILKKSLGLFPVIVLTGARQTGKSTFLKNELPEYDYVTFDDPLQRSYSKEDPEGFLAQFEGGVVLDEIQYASELLPYIKMAVDNDRKPGKWVLTGSQQFHLMKNLSESLAGRAVIHDLAPFSFQELNQKRTLAQVLWGGLYPEPSLDLSKRDLWLRSYIQTYLERDIKHLGDIKDLDAFEKLIALCAARHSQELNINSMARDCGINNVTIKNWLGILESCYVIYRLKPFYNNLGKRIVKSPKLYFCDSSLAAYLTRQPSADALLAGNMGGSFMEGFIVMEAVKAFYNLGKTPDIYFWRSHDGLEVDLLIQNKNKTIPVEIKLSKTARSNFLLSCQRFKDFSQSSDLDLSPPALVCTVDEVSPMPHGAKAMPWHMFGSWLYDVLKKTD